MKIESLRESDAIGLLMPYRGKAHMLHILCYMVNKGEIEYEPTISLHTASL